MKQIEDILADQRLDVMAHKKAYEDALDKDKTYTQLQAEIQKLGLKKMELALSGERDEQLEATLSRLAEKQAEHLAQLAVRPYLCPLCKDEGQVQGRTCICRRRRIYAQHYEAPDPSEFKRSLERYDTSAIDDEEVLPLYGTTARYMTKWALKPLRRLIRQYPNAGMGLLISGPTGTGKTRIAAALAKTAVMAQIDTLFLHAIKVNDLYYAKRMGRPVRMEYLETSGLLIVDDLGTEPKTNNVTDQALYRILERRSDLQLPTVFLTNLDEAALRACYGERISSRLNNPKRFTYVPLGVEICVLPKVNSCEISARH